MSKGLMNSVIWATGAERLCFAFILAVPDIKKAQAPVLSENRRKAGQKNRT